MKDQRSPDEFDPSTMAGLSVTGYVFERLHELLAADVHRHDGANVGITGANLTISFLSMNRATLSVRLLQSIEKVIPYFTGTVLIVDQGSVASDLAQLRQAVASCRLRCEIVELGRNHGVAGGRNRTMAFVKTEWVMFLDNDIYFIRDPLRRIQRDIAQLGCHFLNLPLLGGDGKKAFARGGHLYVTLLENGLHIGGGSVYPQTKAGDRDTPPFLSTFLFGGASVVDRRTFQALGGFDEGMFVGFEDIDFSIRLFRAGQKVGNCGVMALVHDHQAPQNDDDRGYEKRRFASDVIEKSARHLEAKYGFTVWSDAVTEWLKASQKRMGVDGGESARASSPRVPAAGGAARPAATGPKKPRIALIVDVQDWAYGNIARQLMRRLGNHFEFRFIPMDVVDNLARALTLAEDCDVLHFFWRETLGILQTDYVSAYLGWGGVEYAPWLDRFVLQKAISTAVYDHLFLDDEARRKRLPLFRQVDAYYVSSNKLKAIYDGIPDYPKPAAVLPDGVDRELFFPKDLTRLSGATSRELVVGWVGNSAWSAEVEDFKGVHTILKPALERLQAARYRVRADFADRQVRFIPHASMVDYYAGIDVLVCTSKIEGTPNPVLEAMACGVPVVSTDVGIVRDAFGAEQRQFILADRSAACLAQALRRLLDEKALLARLSAENLASVTTWGWDVKALPFVDYFHNCLARRDARLRPAGTIARANA